MMDGHVTSTKQERSPVPFQPLQENNPQRWRNSYPETGKRADAVYAAAINDETSVADDSNPSLYTNDTYVFKNFLCAGNFRPTGKSIFPRCATHATKPRQVGRHMLESLVLINCNAFL